MFSCASLSRSSRTHSRRNGSAQKGMSASEGRTGPVHLVVFIHGFEGTHSDFDNAERSLLEQFESEADRLHERLQVLKPKSNSAFMGTYDGIEKGAIRIWREVMATVSPLGDDVKAISLVGHSLGGLYARFLARLLDDSFLFERAEPRFFVTLASPHLSVRRPINGPVNFAFQKVAAVACKTSQELCMEDDPVKPILFRMTEDSFVNVLRKFKRRILYSNVSNDFQVHFSTASISMKNPYSSESAPSSRSLHYPDLTEWSLNSVHERKAHVMDDIEAFAKSDSKGRLLRLMFVRLNSLEWERYDAMFLTVFAHEQIINKRALFAGKHVVRHLADVFLGKDPHSTQASERDQVQEEIRTGVSVRRSQSGGTLAQI
jgi:pimeloyl-ACP methyl ester carboxylesterase